MHLNFNKFKRLLSNLEKNMSGDKLIQSILFLFVYYILFSIEYLALAYDNNMETRIFVKNEHYDLCNKSVFC